MSSGTSGVSLRLSGSPVSRTAAGGSGPGTRRGQESLVHLALVCGEGGQDLPLLALGHLREVEGAPELSRDFVELVGRDPEVAMSLLQA